MPLATYTGWNFRNEKIGGTQQLVSLLGSYVPFAQTKADRDGAHDPRRRSPSGTRRGSSTWTPIAKAADALVKDGYLLAEDVPPIEAGGRSLGVGA